MEVLRQDPSYLLCFLFKTSTFIQNTMYLAAGMGQDIVGRKFPPKGIHDVPYGKDKKRRRQPESEQTVSFWGKKGKEHRRKADCQKKCRNEVFSVEGSSAASNLHQKSATTYGADQGYQPVFFIRYGKPFHPYSYTPRFDMAHAGTLILSNLQHTAESNQNLGGTGFHHPKLLYNGFYR